MVSAVAFSGNPSLETQIIDLCGCVFLFLHGPRKYGWKSTFAFVAIAFVVSTILEDLSINTGFPFGHYHYTIEGFPRIDKVPIVVGPFYIALGYMAWSIGAIILEHVENYLNTKFNIVILPLVSAFIMCQFDLVQDPVTSTYQGIWIWENGRGVFGVPLVNFLGWYLTCYIFMQIFALYLSRHQKSVKNTEETRERSFWLQPIILYASIAFSYVCYYIHHYTDNTIIKDLAGNSWNVSAMHETAVTIMLFTMLYSIVLALGHLFKPNNNANYGKQ